MPLVVPVLRLFMLFLNVYDTFKTLKLPPPSARRGGKPSLRAMTQRKRNMKGCLSIWVVWCCLALYEKMFDRIVGLVTPFYEEIKSVLLLFLVLTRARGAEPLFLHVIRPMVKPYTETVDSILELTRMFGDIFFALIEIPIDMAHPYLPNGFWCTQVRESDKNTAEGAIKQGDAHYHHIVGASQSSDDLSIPPVSKFYPQHQQNGHQHRRDPVRIPSGNRRLAGSSTSLHKGSARRSSGTISTNTRSHVTSAGGTLGRRSRNSVGLPQTTSQIWYPPPSAYEDENLPANPLSIQPGLPPLQVDDDDWRQYPAFPAAYPLTPLPVVPPPLPFAVFRAIDQTAEPVAPNLDRTTDEVLDFAPISKDNNPVTEQEPGSAVQPENRSSGTSGHSSDTSSSSSGARKSAVEDDKPMDHVDDHLKNSEESGSGNERDSEGDESDEDSDAEDDFNVTLRTPSHLLPSGDQIYTSEKAMASSDSTSSLPSRSTALSTADNASYRSSIVSTSSSSSISLYSSSELSSVAGQKRSFSRGTTNNRVSAFNDSSDDARNATIRGRPISVAPYNMAQPSTSGTLVVDEDSDSSGGAGTGNEIHDISSFGVKRRKVVGTTGVSRIAVRSAINNAQEVRKAPVTVKPAGVRGKYVAGPHTRVRGSSRATHAKTSVARASKEPSRRPQRETSDDPASNHRSIRERTVRGKGYKTQT